MIYIKRWIDYYEDLFQPEMNQKEFFESLLDTFEQPAKFLSVECGPANLSLELSKKYDVTVTDQYQEFVKVVNTKIVENGAHINVHNLNPIDISRFLPKKTFNIVTCLNYRLIFLKDRELAKKFMWDARILLAEGGYLVLDLINFAKYDFSYTKIELPVRKCDRATLYSSLIKNTEEASYHLFQHVVTTEGKMIDEVKDEPVTPISLETFKSAANTMGFSSIEFYSDYNKTPYSLDSEKIICVLKV